MLENIGPAVLNSLSEPIKFAATTWIFVFKGSCRTDINLVSHDFNAPAIVSIKSTQIMQPTYISPDFNATVMVMSKRMSENLFMFMKDTPVSQLSLRHPVVNIPEDVLPDFKNFITDVSKVVYSKNNPYGTQALLFTFLKFIFTVGYKCYEPFLNEIVSKQGRMSDLFLQLVQQNFRKERFLEFYADKLKITAKHLSRTVKKQTGFTAVEWIERYVVLEAKVLLKSSNLNIQQISDELNFPSQSFFGKYFKKLTGMSPKEFRNS